MSFIFAIVFRVFTGIRNGIMGGFGCCMVYKVLGRCWLRVKFVVIGTSCKI